MGCIKLRLPDANILQSMGCSTYLISDVTPPINTSTPRSEDLSIIRASDRKVIPSDFDSLVDNHNQVDQLARTPSAIGITGMKAMS
jgi:hypothetical protein